MASLTKFGAFELDLRARELRKHSLKIGLPEQSIQILAMLLERPGEVVLREEIQKKLWPNDTIVEFDHSINAAVKRLRRALGDEAEMPRFVETLPRRGYRFIFPVDGAGLVHQEEAPPEATRSAKRAPLQVGDPIGKNVSHYRVLGIVGKGGMGVVYRAEDVRLGRQVALKFLPDELADNPRARERFEREARAASALNHPSICTIHEVEEHEGKPFIVMELLQGQTLRECLVGAGLVPAHGRSQQGAPLPLDNMLDLAIQIADGLDAAHQKGIIHRDIKPANIFITTSGQAKILDFGLAKVVAALSERQLEDGGQRLPPEDTPTASLDPDHLTRSGAAMGTAAYMSPEQIRGEKLDARTDLFSFGLVLYEIATEKPAFSGDTIAAVHHAILAGTPKPPRESNPDLPPKLEEIIGKSLEKDRHLRYHSAGDLRADLRQLKSEMESGPSTHGRPLSVPSGPAKGSGQAPAVTGPASLEMQDERQPALREARNAGAIVADVMPDRDGLTGLRGSILWLTGLLTLLVAGAGVGWLLTRHSPPQPSVELVQKRLTYNSSENAVETDAISPDGKYLAYSDVAGIHLKLLSTGEERPIPKPPGVPAGISWTVDSWFPDGTQLLADTAGPGWAQRGMWTVSVLGQSPRELRAGAGGWEVSPDGTQIAFSPQTEGSSSGFAPHEIWLMDSQGENAHRVAALGENVSLNAVRWSPNGQRLAYLKVPGISGYQNPLERARSSIETCDLNGANRAVVVTDSDLLLEDFSWLRNGRIVYSRRDSPDSNDGNLWQVPVATDRGQPTRAPKRITQWTESYLQGLSATADGQRLVVQKFTYRAQVYLGELAAGKTRLKNPPRRLTNDETYDFPTAWTADSKAVLFFSNRNGRSGIFKQQISEDASEAMVTGPPQVGLPRLSADGAWILYMESPKTGGALRMMRVPVNGGAPQFVMETRDQLNFGCGRGPTGVCWVDEVSTDQKGLIVTAFNPLKGRDKVLKSIQLKEPVPVLTGTSLSPDGATFAISRGGEAEIHIRLVSLAGGPDRVITVKGWPNSTALNWSPDGKGFFCGSDSPQGSTLLYVDLNGNAWALWQGGNVVWGVPSPDGHFLAMRAGAYNSNVWQLEHF